MLHPLKIEDLSLLCNTNLKTHFILSGLQKCKMTTLIHSGDLNIPTQDILFVTSLLKIGPKIGRSFTSCKRTLIAPSSWPLHFALSSDEMKAHLIFCEELIKKKARRPKKRTEKDVSIFKLMISVHCTVFSCEEKCRKKSARLKNPWKTRKLIWVTWLSH